MGFVLEKCHHIKIYSTLAAVENGIWYDSSVKRSIVDVTVVSLFADQDAVLVHETVLVLDDAELVARQTPGYAEFVLGRQMSFNVIVLVGFVQVHEICEAVGARGPVAPDRLAVEEAVAVDGVVERRLGDQERRRRVRPRALTVEVLHRLRLVLVEREGSVRDRSGGIVAFDLVTAVHVYALGAGQVAGARRVRDVVAEVVRDLQVAVDDQVEPGQALAGRGDVHVVHLHVGGGLARVLVQGVDDAVHRHRLRDRVEVVEVAGALAGEGRYERSLVREVRLDHLAERDRLRPVSEIGQVLDGVVLEDLDLARDVLLYGRIDVVGSVRDLAVRVEQRLQHRLVVVQHRTGRRRHRQVALVIGGNVDAQFRFALYFFPDADPGVLVRVVFGARYRRVPGTDEWTHVRARTLGLPPVGRLRTGTYRGETEIFAASIGTWRDRVFGERRLEADPAAGVAVSGRGGGLVGRGRGRVHVHGLDRDGVHQGIIGQGNSGAALHQGEVLVVGDAVLLEELAQLREFRRVVLVRGLDVVAEVF